MDRTERGYRIPLLDIVSVNLAVFVAAGALVRLAVVLLPHA